MVSTSSFLTGLKTEGVNAEATPNVMLGAASPLWLMFGGAAMAGATWWWWRNRWREAVNLEALMALSPEPTAPLLLSPPSETIVETAAPVALFEATETVEAPVEAAVEAIEDVLEAAPEAAETVIEAAPATIEAVDSAAEAVAEPVVETVEATADAAPSTIEVVDSAAEAVIEAAVETIEATADASVAVVETVVEAAVETAPALVDDLTRLVGVGPKLAAALADRGVTAFSQIAAWGDAELAEVDKALELKGRAARDAWVAQAKRLAEGPTA